MATGPDGGSRPNPGLPGDRATAPTPLETGTESAWQEFLRLQSQPPSVADSGPAAPPPPSPPSPPSAPIRTTRDPVTLVNTMLLARQGNRSSPVAARWLELHALLPLRDGKAAPPPAGERDHGRLSSIQKRLRLRDQIEWASATGTLDAVHAFLQALPEADWDHFE